MKILFVCEGNICRSPMAEVIFKNILKKNNRTDIVVKSAGTWAQVGAGMSNLCNAALLECGEALPDVPHVATQFSMEMNTEFDHVIDLRTFADPYMGDLETYVTVCKQLQTFCQKLYDSTCKTLS